MIYCMRSHFFLTTDGEKGGKWLKAAEDDEEVQEGHSCEEYL